MMKLGKIIENALTWGEKIDWMDYRTRIVREALNKEVKKTRRGYLIYERCPGTDYYIEYDKEREILAWKNECFGETYYCYTIVSREIMKFTEGVRTDGRYYRGSRLYLQFVPGLPGIILLMTR